MRGGPLCAGSAVLEDGTDQLTFYALVFFLVVVPVVVDQCVDFGYVPFPLHDPLEFLLGLARGALRVPLRGLALVVLNLGLAILDEGLKVGSQPLDQLLFFLV